MDLKSANRWQNILLFGGLIVGLVGVGALDNIYVSIAGLVLMVLSIVVWWMYHRCPHCRGHLGRGTPKRCPHCGAWLADEPEHEEKKKKVQHKKKRR